MRLQDFLQGTAERKEDDEIPITKVDLGVAKEKATSGSPRISRFANIVLGMPSERASIIISAVKVDDDNLPHAKALISKVPAGIRLRVTAKDTGALRSTVNSYLRWIAVASDVSLCGRHSPQDGLRTERENPTDCKKPHRDKNKKEKNKKRIR